jgi:succinate-acetate transporter protein
MAVVEHRRERIATVIPEARVFLQPVAAPSVLGYFALASALIMYGSWFAGGWGTAKSPQTFFPFLLLFGGVGQFGAAMWSYRARNAVAAALHGSWAAFWLGVGVIYLLATTKTITVPPPGTPWDSLGQWFIYMAVITWTTALAALARSPGGFLAQAALGTASALAATALLMGSPGWAEVAGWLFVAAATLAFYVGAALMLDNVYGIVVLPLLHWRRGNRPGTKPAEPVQYALGDPGVKVGQ